MHAFLFPSLLAGTMAALLTAAAAAQQVHVGRALALDDSGERLEIDERRDDYRAGNEPAALDPPVEKPPSEAEFPAAELENKTLGRPSSLLTSARSQDRSGDVDEEKRRAGADEPRAAGMFGNIGRDGLQVVSALAVVIGIMLALRAVVMRSARGLAGGRPSGVLEVLARFPIARGQHLVILKVARRILLLHQAGAAVTTLSEITDPDEVASILARIEAGSSSPREASRFRSLLRHFTGEHERAAKRADNAGIEDAWGGGEVVDLTRREKRGFAGLLSRPERRPVR